MVLTWNFQGFINFYNRKKSQKSWGYFFSEPAADAITKFFIKIFIKSLTLILLYFYMI